MIALYLVNFVCIAGVNGVYYARTAVHRVQQSYLIKNMNITEVYYTSFLDWTHVYVKFFHFYEKELSGVLKIKLPPQEILSKCGLSNWNEVNSNYNTVSKCPSG